MSIRCTAQAAAHPSSSMVIARDQSLPREDALDPRRFDRGEGSSVRAFAETCASRPGPRIGCSIREKERRLVGLDNVSGLAPVRFIQDAAVTSLSWPFVRT